MGQSVPFRPLSPRILLVTGMTCLGAFAIVAVAVAHGNGPYGFEAHVATWFGAPSSTATWAVASVRLAAPVIGAVVVVSVITAIARRAVLRVLLYGSLALLASVVSDNVVKPLVHRSFYEELTFPSGSLTAVCATALAAWLALSPVLRKRTSTVALVIGVAWTLLTAIAVVGALWHTPVDVVGSILLSVGILTAGGSVLEYATRGALSRRAPPSLEPQSRAIPSNRQ